jgi:AcrR family transcriptional regulator
MSPTKERKNIRRREILAAALECWIRYGFAKTVFDDVARKAGVSRSLLYAYFQDKKHLFLSVARDLLDEQRQKTEAVLRSDAGDKRKLQEVLELWSVDLYAKVANSPHGGELLDEGMRAWEEIGVKYNDYLIRALSRFVGGAKVAALLVLSIKGIQGDRPSVPILRKRIRLLAELGWQRRRRP